MLASRRMSSYEGQQAFPFGYEPNALHGIGLPSYMNPGPPPGQPLLTNHENQNFNSFLDHFDTNSFPADNNPGSHPQFHNDIGHGQTWTMPPTYVASETSLGPRSAIDPHQLQMGGFMHAGLVGNEMGSMTAENPFDNSLHQPPIGFADNHFPNPLAQLQAAAVHTTYGWQHPYPQNIVPMQAVPRQVPRYGSDSHFQATGYVAPSGEIDPGQMEPNLDWIEAQSSATNTQPNTQPSSPNFARKRKLHEFQQDDAPNGISHLTNGHVVEHAHNPTTPKTSSARRRKPNVKQELPPNVPQSRLPRPVHNANGISPHSNEIDTDADAESDDDQKSSVRQTSPPAPWPSHKARPPRSTKPPQPLKSSRSRKSTANANHPIKPKSKPPRPSTSSSNHSSSRVPLTADQKKANHTSSEQRRRDNTAKAYAELYDLVPELEGMGKQSTMKRLETVVAKLVTVKDGVGELRARWEAMTGSGWVGVGMGEEDE